MNDEQWDKLLDSIEDRFGRFEIQTEDIISDKGLEVGQIEGLREIAEFQTESGMIRLVRESRPAVLGAKFHYSHRKGDSARTEYIFSDTEMTHKVLVYKMNDYGDWQLFDMNTLSF